jgi:hypothetical protein
MSERDDSHFDDPALKAAVRRACAGERAPHHLREKIVNLMVETEPAPVTRASASRWRTMLGPNPKRMLVAACAAVIGVMLAAYQIKEHVFPERVEQNGGGYALTELPQAFALEMVKTHENHAKLPDHHILPGDDLANLTKSLTAAVQVPVSAINFTGWQFKGAGTCKVGEVTAAHLMYANAQGQSFSVFELSADAVYGAPNGARYTQLVEGHAVSGLRHGTGLYCVVGSAGSGSAQPMTKEEVEKLRDSLAATLPEVQCGGGRCETIARL